MGILHANPFLVRLLYHIPEFMVVRPLAALHQRPGIDFILQDTDHRSRGPFRVRPVREAALGVGQPPADFIGKRREDAQGVQLIRDPFGASTVNLGPEDVAHHPGGIFVHHKLIPVFL